MPPYRIALVGTGGIAAIHAENVARLDGRAELVAVCDIDAERLGAFADRWSVPGRHQDLASLLAEERPDLVHLCTPPGLHIDQAIECLEAGVDVLVEKPPALSLADFDRLDSASRASGASVACLFQHRFGDAAIAVSNLIEDRTWGRPLVAQCSTLWYRPYDYFDLPWRGTWAAEGGGPTMGHGIHQFDLLLHLLGPWSEVTAVAARLARPVATEDVSAALVRFENGAVATVINSLLSPRQTSAIRIDTEHATIELDHLYGYSTADWTLTPAPGSEELVAAHWDPAALTGGSGHAAQFRAVLDAKDAGRPLPVTQAEGRATLEFAAALYASAFTGATVARGEIVPGHPFYDGMDGHGAGDTALARTALAGAPASHDKDAR